MIFENGFCKIQGASDFADSSHLAGILAIFGHPQAIPCWKYIKASASGGLEYVRHPDERRFDFSRDQATLLMAGLLAQDFGYMVQLARINGKDVLPPSVRGLEAIAKTGKASWLSHWWLKREIQWHATLQPLEEPFQIISMCISYDRAEGTKYLKLWTDSNKLWKWSCRRYLSQLDGEWRQEPELCEWIINKIENMTR